MTDVAKIIEDLRDLATTFPESRLAEVNMAAAAALEELRAPIEAPQYAKLLQENDHLLAQQRRVSTWVDATLDHSPDQNFDLGYWNAANRVKTLLEEEA